MQLAYELIKKLVLAWDPDLTKMTPAEAAALKGSADNYDRGDYVTSDDINWE